MEKYKKLIEESIDKAEESVFNYWKSINLLEKTLKKGEKDPSFVFYEGPPTANGNPGVHHVLSRTLKDSICRYKTMSGYQVKRRAGWDTHGLPVEIQVEKELGLTSKQQIEEYGVAKFNQKCRESVFSFEKQWRIMSDRMAFEVDMDNPYITLDNDYIESVWWILDQFNKQGYIYEGHKIIPYCPRCGTGLASHEVAQGYAEVKTNTLIAKFKKKGSENEYFLAWTTTPWTLPSNVSLTVNPDVDYIKAKVGDEYYYVSRPLADKVLKEGYEVVQVMKGKDLEYMEYEQLMPFVKSDKKAFFVTLGDYVTIEDGTGIVHTAPAFGEDDYNLGKKYGLPVLQPVDETGEFTDTPWKGKFVMEDGLDVEIIRWLAKENKLYSKEKVVHNYPHCWRCKTPLLYYAKPSWYIEMTKLKDKLIENNNTVNWFPPFVGEKRFGNWLENLNDWAISRSRYWGTPFPIWRCNCGHIESVGSRSDLAKKAIENVDPETVELHRPYVDDIHLKCEKCGGKMNRVKDVIDCWFDSGAMPYAQNHYPFENKENFDQLFPADFISEGIDQTRGWFYSLLAISTFVMGRAPYKNVLVLDLILDKDGKKMSKSKGNTVDPMELFDKFGADAVRTYLLYVSPPWTPTKFDREGLKEIYSKFIGTLKNIYNFFTLYANTDGVDPKGFFVEYKDRPELDRWILSKYNNLLEKVEKELEQFELNRCIKIMVDFINDDLSNWYIRRSRRRFWSTELTEDKKSVYNTTYELLTGISKMIAPFAPFMSEEIYRNLTGETSVHMVNYPRKDSKLLDEKLEEKMDLVKNLVTLGRASRESEKIKVRQPLQKALVDGKYETIISDLVEIIKEELNVKEVVFEKELSKFMNFTLKPNFKEVGSVLGSKIGEFTKVLNSLDAHDTVKKLENGEKLTVNLLGEDFSFGKECVLINTIAKEGFNVSLDNNLFVILDTKITDDLRNEGYARELVSKIQQIRKLNGFEVLDRIVVEYYSDDEIAKAIEIFKEYIKSETLADELNRVYDESLEKQNLNDHMTGIKVKRL